MACQRPSPIITFERDVPNISFLVTEGGEPMRLFNYIPELHVLDQGGNRVAQFGMESLNIGELVLTELGQGDLEEFYAEVFKLTTDSGYTAQIYLNALPFASEEIGLNDIVDPYWNEYIPPMDPSHTPGWFSGETKQDQTIPTEIPWAVREAFKLRGS